MSQITAVITVNGFTNLMTALIAKGYKSAGTLKQFHIYNSSATVVYLHLTNNSATAPTLGTDGVPVSSAGTTSPLRLEMGCDAAQTWLYSATSVDVKILATGDGI